MIEPVIFVIGLTVAFAAGYVIGDDRRTPIHTEEIDAYIQSHFPSEWVAYKRGVREGYEQGHRDGSSNEPA